MSRARLRWKELLGLSVAREAFPLWWHLWHPSAAPSWVSWLELTLGFVLALGRLPPPFDRRQQRWLGQSDLAHRPDVDTTVSAVVASFRGLLDPLLSSLNWPPAPFRIPGAHPVLRTPLPLVSVALDTGFTHSCASSSVSMVPHRYPALGSLACSPPMALYRSGSFC